VKKYGLERTRKRQVARTRTLQLSATLAETRLVVWTRSMLVALCTISPNNHTNDSRTDFYSTHDSHNAIHTHNVKGTRDSDPRTTDDLSAIAVRHHQETIRRAG
jgi:hypothetical protein